jgi:ubiquinone/menaquinone biosynthesis C-methylase UbiE
MTEKAKVAIFYKKLSKMYEKKRLSTEKSQIMSAIQNEWFIKNLGNAPIICLEIGCGTGRLTGELTKKAGFLVATDTSLEMIKINKRKIPKHQKNEAHFVICDASHLPFLSRTFTNIASARVFWHIRDYPQTLNEAFRVLSNGGSLQFDFPCLWGPFSLYYKFRRIKHEVLTLFIDKKAIKEMFKKAKNLVLHGNTSIILYFLPDRLLRINQIKKTIYFLDIMDVPLFSDWFYTYYLVKVIK